MGARGTGEEGMELTCTALPPGACSSWSRALATRLATAVVKVALAWAAVAAAMTAVVREQARKPVMPLAVMAPAP